MRPSSVLRRSIDRGTHGSETAFEDLRLFSELLTRVEREQFAAPPCKRCWRSCPRIPGSLAGHRQPEHHRQFRRFAAQSGDHAVRHSAMYTLNVALAAERWRRLHGKAVRTWIEVDWRFRSAAVACRYAYEHPDDPFSEIRRRTRFLCRHGAGSPADSSSTLRAQ